MNMAEAIDLAEAAHPPSGKPVYVLINDMGYEDGALLGVYETLEQAKDEEKKYPNRKWPYGVTICHITLNAPIENATKEIIEVED